MEKNNNGKLAIAIVAMFVVALSIVGFTYAYFVASVQGNDANTSVNVQAGVLKIAYDKGQVLTATNIVPGWKSNNDMIYDPVHSLSKATVQVTDPDTQEVTTVEETHITAVSKAAIEADPNKTVSANATAPVGPVTFTVTDQSTEGETAYYGIRLVSVNNELYAKEPDNFKVTLTSDAGFEETITLTDETTQYIGEPVAITTATDAEKATVHTYTLNAEYVEATTKQEGTGKSVTLTVEVVGLQLVDGVYKDAQGITWNAA